MTADLIIYDTIGPALPWDRMKPLGGSEVQMVLLKEGLEKRGKEVLITKADDCWRCKTLLLNRYSKPPTNIKADLTFVFVSDIEPYPVTGAPLFVSDYQRRQWWMFASQVLPSFISDEVYNLRDLGLSKSPGQWIYASALHKGLADVLQRTPAVSWSQLVVTNTYDDKPAQDVAPGIKWLGRSTPYQLARYIARSQGLYYPHHYPECWSVVVHLAKLLGCVSYMPCVGHETCGVKEAWEAPTTGRPFSNSGVAIDQWIGALGL